MQSVLPQRFEIRGLLGQGGMGVVYRAYDRVLAQDVALKTLNGLSPDGVYRLKREFRLIRDVSHPNLVLLHELFAEPRWCFFTMEPIDGVDVVSHLRAPSGMDGALPSTDVVEARLRRLAPQLLAALRYLHEIGRIHRDVKPSNVLVTSGERLVLLDFGLATAIEEDRVLRTTQEHALVGTLPYMAPEQAWGMQPGPSADWYSAGVTLFQALTGQLPVTGTAMQIIDGKRRSYRPRDRIPDIARDLDELVFRLLDTDPVRRAGAKEVEDWFISRPALPLASSAPSAGTARLQALVGRDPELGLLNQALARTRDRNIQLVEVHGQSGVGKSALVRGFVERLEGDAVVLQGRCHLQETVLYNAVDGVVDDLCHRLRNFQDVAALLPRHTSALRRLFPVMQRLPAIAQAPDTSVDLEARELRSRGSSALVELLARLGDRRTVVIWIDDFQWSDLDSIELLSGLVNGADPPHVMLILSFREEDLDSAAVRAWQASRRTEPTGRLTDLPLAALAPEACRTIARQALPAIVESQLVEQVVRESAGSPFLLGQICQYLHSAQRPIRSSDGSLAQALTLRLRELDQDDVHLLRLVATAESPIEEPVLQQAAKVSELRARISRLVAGSLLRRTLRAGKSALDVSHDRVRGAIFQSCQRDEHVGYHRALAGALLASDDRDPQRVAHHLLAAGDLAHAREHVLAAADQAMKAMAFARAAAWYRRALDIDGFDRIALLPLLGRALLAAGRGQEAAEVFREAAGLRVQLRGAGDLEAMDLMRAAGQSYLEQGFIDEGMDVFRQLLGPLGIRLPRTPRQARWQSLRYRLQFMLRGSKFEARDESELPPSRIVRLDILMGLMRTLSLVDHTVADALFTRLLLDSLDLGEPRRAIWNLMREACSEAAIPSPTFQRRARRLLDEAERRIVDTRNPLLEGSLLASRGVVAWMTADWRTAVDNLDRARQLFLARAPTAQWEINFCDTWGLAAETHLGRQRDVRNKIGGIIEDAELRGDRLALRNCLMGAPTLARLAADEPERLLADLERARILVGQNTSADHYMLALGRVQTLLYQGNPRAARTELIAAWPRLAHEQLLGLSFIRDELLGLRARTALALAGAEPTPAARGPLLADARRCAKRLRRHRLPVGKAWAALVDAALANLEGRAAERAAHLRLARTLFEDGHMDLWAQATSCVLAAATEDSSACGQGLTRLREDGIRAPVRLLRLLIPAVCPEEVLVETPAVQSADGVSVPAMAAMAGVSVGATRT